MFRFLQQGVWAGDLQHMASWRRSGVASLRVLSHLIGSFRSTGNSLQAAGLTLVTLLALVPMLALVFAVAKALGYADKLEQQLLAVAAQWPKDLQAAIESLRQMVAAVNFSALGLLGLVTVLWSGLALFARVEDAFNVVWRTKKSRALHRRLTDFVTLTVIVPPLAVAALVGSSLLGSIAMLDSLRQNEWLGWLAEAGLGFVPHVLLWVAFAALYKIMPSANVRWSAAAVSGIVAGSSLILLNGVYVRFQVGVANANALYGTLAALPLLLIYLQLTWTVVLAGAEVGYAVQNLQRLRGGAPLPPPSPAVVQRIAWHLLADGARAFRGGQRGVRLADVCARLDLPPEHVEQVAQRLLAGNVLVRLAGDPELLMPARPPELIALPEVLAVLAGDGDQALARVRLPEAEERQLERANELTREQLARLTF